MVRDRQSQYTPAVRAQMAASARASWQRRRADGYVSQRDMRKAAPELYHALKLYVAHYGDPLKVARAALAKADGR